jgi:hypothetical protein
MYHPGQYFADGLADVLVVRSRWGQISNRHGLEADNRAHPVAHCSLNPGLSVNACCQGGHEPEGPRSRRLALEWNEASNEIGTEIVYDRLFSHHTERNLVGYKYYEYGMIPLFPFGFGLSYQTPTVSSSFADGWWLPGCTIRVRDGWTRVTGAASTVVQVCGLACLRDCSDDTPLQLDQGVRIQECGSSDVKCLLAPKQRLSPGCLQAEVRLP